MPLIIAVMATATAIATCCKPLYLVILNIVVIPSYYAAGNSEPIIQSLTYAYELYSAVYSVYSKLYHWQTAFDSLILFLPEVGNTFWFQECTK